MIDDSDGKVSTSLEPMGLVDRLRWIGPVIGVITLLIAFPVAERLQFDRSITAMFLPDDPDLLTYQKLQNDFGGNAVAMLVYHDPELWSENGIARNESITSAVANVDGVDGVISPSVLNDLVKKVKPGSFLSGKAPLLDRRDGVARGFDQMFVGYTHSPDHQHGAVVAMLDPSKVHQAVEGLRMITNQTNEGDQTLIGDAVLVGEPVLIEEAFELIERDGVWLATLTISLLSIVVLLSLLDLRFVFLSIVVIVWSVTLTKAAMSVLGMELSLVSTILTAIATVVTVTSVLHLGVRYRIVRRRGGTVAKAASIATMLLAVPIIWTCLTDAAGFAALSVSRILPVQQFGLMIAIASTAVLTGLLLFGPFLMLAKFPDSFVPDWFSRMFNRLRRDCLEPFQRHLRHIILSIADWSVRHFTIVVVACGVMILVIFTGIGKAKTETSFLNNFRSDSSIVSAYQRVEEQFGGAGVWDVVIDGPEKMTSSYLKRVRALEGELRKIDFDGVRLKKVISIADADAVVSRSGLMRLVSPKMRLGGMQAIVPVFYNALVSETGSDQKRHLRLMLRSEENLSADEKAALIAETRRVIAANPLGESAQVTGYYVLMTRLIDQLIGDGWRCFAASTVLVWILLIVSGRSLMRATVALMVNLFPALLVIAALGWMGGKINMGSAMIAAVSIGLSIDGSVHFLSSYRRKRRRGHSPEVAATHSAGNVGAAIVLATVALVIGFGGLATSEFVPTATFGALVAAALVIGAIVNLTVLPTLIAKLD